jgi:hypothetical protein
VQERSTVSLFWELIKRVRLPSLPSVYWSLRIGLLIFGFLVITNYKQVFEAFSNAFSLVEVIEVQKTEIKEELKAEIQVLREEQRDVVLDAVDESHRRRCLNITDPSARLAYGCPGATPTDANTQASRVVVAPPERLKIAPSSSISDGDTFIQGVDDSLYLREQKRSTIRPSTE